MCAAPAGESPSEPAADGPHAPVRKNPPPHPLLSTLGYFLLALGWVSLWLAVTDLSKPLSYFHSEVQVAHSPPPVHDQVISNDNREGMSDQGMSLWLFCSAALVLGGLLLARRNFSLGRLLGSALICGALASLPMFKAHAKKPYGRIEMLFPRQLAEDARARIETKLQPVAALSLLPPGFWKQMRLAPGMGLKAVAFETLERPSQHPGMACVLTFESGLTWRQCEAFMEYYLNYLEDLAVMEARAQGQPVGSPEPFQINADWERWRPEWQKARDASEAPPQ
ncbi:MAG: hypothetical protein HY291_07000 [Planctomycetes bacterium]|nr:hypothetical protein [Planctomycetota bacterium]